MRERLKLIRKELNLTQEQLAQRLGIGKAALSMIETGKCGLSTRNKNIFYTFLFAAAASCIFTASTLLGISVFTEDEYVGIVIGVAGLGMALLTYPIYKSIMASRRKKYGAEILALSEKIMNE